MSYFNDENDNDKDIYPRSDSDDDDDNKSDTDVDENIEENDELEEDVDEDLEEEDLDEVENDDGEGRGKDEEESDEDYSSEDGGNSEGGNEDEPVPKSVTKKKNVKSIPKKNIINKSFIDNLSDDDDDDPDGETYLKKFDKEINDNYIVNNHPECALQNYDEILAMTKVVRDKNNIIIDDLHRTIPHLTKYERARILGQRAKQIETGATPFIKVPENVIDGYLIAQMELEQGRIPFIIRRPLPNGGSEYWKISDLENIAF
jgi:DNA-directed RNA polymerase subunit K/omega